ncbi:MAG: phosphoribosylaminoimidazolesuccinocarboxamide synthase [Gammaproteobacteria bacterium]|nr:phosphoribosylaminoimidazolesuccinocarboxamide synthase [Gammaproteobacteria bacterium]NNJ72677.1 phosphoribosylaminoimidazolesuccinocarboxamide synthase [Enterobacterales bacterium]
MSQAVSVLDVNDDLPIRTSAPVHSGKVRSVYWLSKQDSQRLIQQFNYNVAPDSELAIMVISDRISAYECIWHGEGNMRGIPGKGAALNAVSNHWFKCFKDQGLADSHILDVPHPLIWIVQKARPVMIEAIARQYITGSMWRAYAKGERNFCGIQLPEGLSQDQKLPELLITPSTKGVITGVADIPEQDDVNVSKRDLKNHYQTFKFQQPEDIDRYEQLLTEGFQLISRELAKIDQIFVDTKFEFGYVTDREGQDKLIYMDEVGTPDSSRIWHGPAWRDGRVEEQSKEAFRQQLLAYFPDPDILLNKERMTERYALARDNLLPLEVMMSVSKTYCGIAEQITGKAIHLSDNPRQEIIDVLSERYGLIA